RAACAGASSRDWTGRSRLESRLNRTLRWTAGQRGLRRVRMRHDYSLLFSVAALGLVFGRQPGLVPKMSLGPSTADVLPREQAAGRDPNERQADGAARGKK